MCLEKFSKPVTILQSETQELPHCFAFRRRLWGMDKGSESTEEVLFTMKKWAFSDNVGQRLWEDAIAEGFP
ncbi:hypothetical protein VP01_1118g2 [Puccinia sorghi]|uniref:Uncharacterized protein n=1 Tax=Puccinia sorghi TaxID=27349 RepID=A0A0L6VSP8_9BASI|nr:hypothetical protein VP01_1118g2 [Puccinia sorghi]